MALSGAIAKTRGWMDLLYPSSAPSKDPHYQGPLSRRERRPAMIADRKAKRKARRS